jgi:hypothetical protein
MAKILAQADVAPDKSRYRTCGFGSIQLSGKRANQALSESRAHNGNKDY